MKKKKKIKRKKNGSRFSVKVFDLMVDWCLFVLREAIWGVILHITMTAIESVKKIRGGGGCVGKK